MASAFKMGYRLLFLKPVLTSLALNPEWVAASQKCLKAWSDGQRDAAKKLKPNADGNYRDNVLANISDSAWFKTMDDFVHTFTPAMYLLRLMDSAGPCLGKVYYCCCLMDKFLRIAIAKGTVQYAQEVQVLFMKRWKRWHRPVHTLAYALDCFGSLIPWP